MPTTEAMNNALLVFYGAIVTFKNSYSVLIILADF